jgi:threonine/homoserine/homoserine lactone efflux protein
MRRVSTGPLQRYARFSPEDKSIVFAGIDHIGLFIAAGLLLNLTPGPDVLYIVGSGLRGGWRAGAVAALGITAGCFVHISAATLGLSALIAASATAFTLLKWIGAAYLVYVGAGMLLARSRRAGTAMPSSAQSASGSAGPGMEAREIAGMNLHKVFRQGFWTNALNPKVALFFLAFLPQFIDPEAQHKTWTFLLLGLIFNINALPVNMAYGLGAAWLSSRFQTLQRGLAWLERGAGALFIYFGIRLAVSESSMR